MTKQKLMTIGEVKKLLGIDVPGTVGRLQTIGRPNIGAIVITAKGEAMLVEWLRGVMPTMSGLIVGVINDPAITPKPPQGKAEIEALNAARAAARIFIDRSTVETRAALEVALDRLAGRS